MRTTRLLVGAAFAGSFAGALALAAADTGHAAWYLSRASGLVLMVLLTASTLIGLLVSTRAAEPGLPRPLAFDLHQFVSSLTLTFIAIHAGTLLFDQYLPFSAAALLVPFWGDYQAFWMALGVGAMWLTVAVIAISWYRSRVGRALWRQVHYLSFAAYAMAVVHGIGAGPDTRLPFVYWLYSVSVASVLALLTYRIGLEMRRRGQSQPSAEGEPGRGGDIVDDAPTGSGAARSGGMTGVGAIAHAPREKRERGG